MRERGYINKNGKFIPLLPIDELCEEIKVKFEHEEEILGYLREENERLKSEHYKDEELAKMKEAYDRMKDEYGLGFPISRDEYSAIKTWIEGHHHYTQTAIGGAYSYEFTPTSIGIVGKVKCTCGASFTFRELD